MNGDYSIFNNSMNGVITLSDGVSFISDGQAQHENVIYSNFIKSEDEATTLTNNTLTTETIIATTLNATNISANSETLGTLTVTNLNVDNYGFYVNGFGNTITSSLPTTMNNTLKIVGNEFTLENGNINQIGTTSSNILKTTSINGSLTCQSDLIQTGGNTILKNITCDNVTMNSNKSISQSGSGVSNSLGTTTVSNLVVTSSMTFPASVTIPSASQTGDLSFTDGARIIQDLTEAGTNYNTLMYSKIEKLDVNGNITQTSGTTTILNTTIQGTAQIQGDITQTSGQSVFKAIGCDQVSLNANKDVFFSNGTGKIDQSVSTGTNNLSAITMNANTNFTQSGTGIVSQSGTGTNALKNTSITGTLAVSSSSTFTGNVQCNGTLTMGANRSITQPTGTTSNQFQTTTISNLTCPTATITDLTTTTLSVGNVSNIEIQYLDGVVAPIQDQINSINATTSGNSTALTGIVYTAGTDTTTIDNNVVIPVGKTLSVGSITNVATNITSLNTSVSNLDASLNTLTNNFNTTTSGITYNAGTDTTTIDNNVTINKPLVVQGMNIKAEIDALDSSFTTGTLNSTSAFIADLSSNNIVVNTQVRSKEYELFFENNTTAISAPTLTNGLGIGTGDGASYTTFNQGLFSWNSTGFVDTCFKVCKAFIDHRTGNISTQGNVTAFTSIINFLTVLNDLAVSGVTTLGTTIINSILTVSNITSPSSGNINITTASGRNMYLNNGKGSSTGDVYINTDSIQSNVYIDNGSLTLSTGNVVVTEGVVSTSSLLVDYAQFKQIEPYPATTSTAVKTSLIADADKVITSPATYFGVWFIDAGVGDYKLDRFRFVPSSVAACGTVDDYWIVCAGYKVVLYRYSNYAILAGQRPWSGSTDTEAQTRTIDNTNGTSFIGVTSSSLYGAANQVGSCKVYYKNVEITLSYLS